MVRESKSTSYTGDLNDDLEAKRLFAELKKEMGEGSASEDISSFVNDK